jgi:alkylation response protein AidB-like acyl-CoA dehydrogenase
VEAALAAIDIAIEIHGANGFAAEFGLTSLWGIVEVVPGLVEVRWRSPT